MLISKREKSKVKHWVSLLYSARIVLTFNVDMIESTEYCCTNKGFLLTPTALTTYIIAVYTSIQHTETALPINYFPSCINSNNTSTRILHLSQHQTVLIHSVAINPLVTSSAWRLSAISSPPTVRGYSTRGPCPHAPPSPQPQHGRLFNEINRLHRFEQKIEE